MAQKKISDLTLRSDFDGTCNLPVDDAAQSWRVTGEQIKDFVQDEIAPLTTLGDILAAGASGVPQRVAGNTAAVEKMLVQTGTGSASAVPSWREVKTPTVQKFTSSSGTYTTPAGVKWIKVRMIGGGGGGGGSSTAANGGAGGTGGTSTFGTSLLTAPGAAGSSAGSVATINSPAIELVKLLGSGGNNGGCSYFNNTVSNQANVTGGMGGVSPFGGAGVGGGTGTGTAGQANTGSGGGGAGIGIAGTGGTYTGSGGGSGAYLEAVIASPSATYSYAVGAGGTAGSAGTNGAAGSAGGSGVIIVEEYYQ